MTYVTGKKARGLRGLQCMNADGRREEAVALTHGAQMKKSVITRAGDKVQGMSAVGAMQSGRHT